MYDDDSNDSRSINNNVNNDAADMERTFPGSSNGNVLPVDKKIVRDLIASPDQGHQHEEEDEGSISCATPTSGGSGKKSFRITNIDGKYVIESPEAK